MMNTLSTSLAAALEHRLEDLPGQISCVIACPDANVAVQRNAEQPLLAASVIKLPIMAVAFHEAALGHLNLSEALHVPHESKVPSCGALTYLHDGLEVTLLDLITLMIILSDNTATNLLIDRIGMDVINRVIRSFGLSEGTMLRRKLFDSEAAARGLENTVTANDMASLLKAILNGTLVSAEASAQMLQILMNQRLNGKIPFYLHDKGIRTAHKTGEDDDITHDVGIILTDQPIIFCFLSNETDVPIAERVIQDLAFEAVRSIHREAL